jgi:hypothetical protein
MIWFLERQSEMLICEIRRNEDGEVYEFEVASAQGPPETHRHTSPRGLIDQYLQTHRALAAQGWRPRVIDDGESSS